MVLFRGPCDIKAITSYIKKSNNIVVESDFKGVFLDEVWDASISLYLKQCALGKQISSAFVEPLFYPDKSIFEKYEAVVISIIGDGILGIYENNDNHQRIAYGFWNKDATFNSGELYLNDSNTARFAHLTKEDYCLLSKQYKYLGRADPVDVANDLFIFVKKFSTNTKIIVLLGPTVESVYGECNVAMTDGLSYYKALNKTVINKFKSVGNVFFINPNNYYKKPLSKYCLFYYNYPSILHYSCHVYYRIAKEISRVCNSVKINHIFKIKQLFKRTTKHIMSIFKFIVRGK